MVSIRRSSIVMISVIFAAAALGDEVKLQLVANGFQEPLFICAPSGDNQRLFVVEAKTGLIRIIKNGTTVPTPFLDLSSKILNTANEQGLLGLAFHPDYASNGYFYVDYTAAGGGAQGQTIVERYTVSTNPDIADLASAHAIFSIPQPYVNHNGGMVAFGPNDGYLYIGMGDGGSGNDPDNRAQNLTDPLGKILRIDVDSGNPYSIPSSNPFALHPTYDKRIWSYGLRNPWRFSFDRVTGDLYIGDVGQVSREEVDFQPADSSGGENYGWKIAEGFACTGGAGTCGTDPGFTAPIYDYGRTEGQAVTGGYVYRGNAIPELIGNYIFGDVQTARIWTFHYDGAVTGFEDLTTQLLPPQFSILGLVTFGEDAMGELYLTDYGHGRIFKIVPVSPPLPGISATASLILSLVILMLGGMRLWQPSRKR